MCWDCTSKGQEGVRHRPSQLLNVYTNEETASSFCKSLANEIYLFIKFPNTTIEKDL